MEPSENNYNPNPGFRFSSDRYENYGSQGYRNLTPIGRNNYDGDRFVDQRNRDNYYSDYYGNEGYEGSRYAGRWSNNPHRQREFDKGLD